MRDDGARPWRRRIGGPHARGMQQRPGNLAALSGVCRVEHPGNGGPPRGKLLWPSHVWHYNPFSDGQTIAIVPAPGLDWRGWRQGRKIGRSSRGNRWQIPVMMIWPRRWRAWPRATTWNTTKSTTARGADHISFGAPAPAPPPARTAPAKPAAAKPAVPAAKPAAPVAKAAVPTAKRAGQSGRSAGQARRGTGESAAAAPAKPATAAAAAPKPPAPAARAVSAPAAAPGPLLRRRPGPLHPRRPPARPRPPGLRHLRHVRPHQRPCRRPVRRHLQRVRQRRRPVPAAPAARPAAPTLPPPPAPARPGGDALPAGRAFGHSCQLVCRIRGAGAAGRD